MEFREIAVLLSTRDCQGNCILILLSDSARICQRVVNYKLISIFMASWLVKV